MPRSICLVDGHPDPAPGHFTPALCDAYEQGAREGGHAVSRIVVASLDVPFLRAPADFLTEPPRAIKEAQALVTAAEHVVVVFPMWLGGMPAYCRAFFEQLSRAGFALGESDKGGFPVGKLAGRSARVVATMGMPGQVYSLFFGAHGVRGFERSVLAIAGFKPVHETLFGMVDSAEVRVRMLGKMRKLGREGR